MGKKKKERFLNCVIDSIYKEKFAFCSKNLRIKTKTFWQNFAKKDIDTSLFPERIIKGITVGGKTNEISKIKFAPFESVFKEEILFDTTLQGSDKTLEEMIAMYIAEYWINNADAVQNIPGLEVETISSTTDWGFHLTSDVKGLNKTIINFMSVIIKRSLTKYQVGLYIEPNFKEKKICVKIGRKNTSVFRIETHLPNVIKKNIVLNETTEDVNKLILYSSENLEDCIVYYKHPDKTVDTINENRIVPVIYDIQTVASREDERIMQNQFRVRLLSQLIKHVAYDAMP